MFKKSTKVYVEVSPAEIKLIVYSLLLLRNRLISEGRYTDAVDEMLLKLQ